MEPTTCSVEGCNRKRRYVATGWCQTHYHRYWRNRTLDTVGRKEPLSTKYRAVHTRVASLFGKAEHTACVECGASAKEWAYDGTDPTELTTYLTV